MFITVNKEILEKRLKKEKKIELIKVEAGIGIVMRTNKKILGIGWQHKKWSKHPKHTHPAFSFRKNMIYSKKENI